MFLKHIFCSQRLLLFGNDSEYTGKTKLKTSQQVVILKTIRISMLLWKI